MSDNESDNEVMPTSVTEYDGKSYKKTYIQKDGSVKTLEYKKKEGTKTINEQLTENMDETIEKWKNESVAVITGNWEEELKKYKGNYCRYQSIKKFGKGKGKDLVLRNGGFISKAGEEFVTLVSSHGVWSLQYADARQIFVKERKKRKKKEKVPKELKKAQKKIRKEYEEQKEEEANDIIQEQKEAEEEAPPVNRRQPLPRKLTDDEADAVLKRAYYEEDMKFGRDKLYHTLKENGHRISRKQVDEWLKKQALYQLDKPVFKAKDFVTQTAKEPNSIWNIDLVEVDGDSILLNAVDRFSKYAYSRILRNKTANQVVTALKSIFRTVKPKTIISDNGVEFKSAVTQDYLKSVNVKQFFSSPHQPQSNGLVERFNRTLQNLYKKMTYQASEEKMTFTQDVLDRILKAYNNSYHSIIEMNPSDAMKPENKADVLKANDKQISVGMKQLQNAKDDLEKGEQVRISLDKFSDKKTKKYRTNWSEEIFFVKNVMRGNGMKPIQYKIEDGEGKPLKGQYKREEVQPIKYIENADEVDVPYTIDKFIKEKGDEIQSDLGRTVYKTLFDKMNE